MSAVRLRFLFLNLGHFADHLFMLIFAKAAFDAGVSFGFGSERAYAEMIPYGTPAAVLFGACAPIAAWLADRWGRNVLIVIFFIGIGLAAIATSFATSPLEIAIGLAAIGVFAAIYHPVGIAMLVQGGGNVGYRIGLNGVWGNMGVAAAPLLTGFVLAHYDWRLAFLLPGIVSIAIGFGFWAFVRSGRAVAPAGTAAEKALVGFAPDWQRALIAIFLVTLSGGFVFGAMTFIVPRLFEVHLGGISTDVAVTGSLAALVYALSAFAQLVMGLLLDRHAVKPLLFTVVAAQPVLLAVMALLVAGGGGQADLPLFLATLVAMLFMFGQIPVSDTVISRYVPDQWRTKVLSVKFALNLTVGASVLPIAGGILQGGGGFETVLVVLAIAAAFGLAAVLVLPGRPAAQAAPASA